MAVQDPKPSAAAIKIPSTTKLHGKPQVISVLGTMPRLVSLGVTMPQVQNVHSMVRLMANRPVAASIELQPPTCVIQGPAHKVWMATMPP